jgi:hypothetical protein
MGHCSKVVWNFVGKHLSPKETSLVISMRRVVSRRGIRAGEAQTCIAANTSLVIDMLLTFVNVTAQEAGKR